MKQVTSSKDSRLPFSAGTPSALPRPYHAKLPRPYHAKLQLHNNNNNNNNNNKDNNNNNKSDEEIRPL